MTKTKVVDLNVLYNFVIDNLFIWIIYISKFESKVPIY
jgi:hypothetical protein